MQSLCSQTIAYCETNQLPKTKDFGFDCIHIARSDLFNDVDPEKLVDLSVQKHTAPAFGPSCSNHIEESFISTQCPLD